MTYINRPKQSSYNLTLDYPKETESKKKNTKQKRTIRHRIYPYFHNNLIAFETPYDLCISHFMNRKYKGHYKMKRRPVFFDIYGQINSIVFCQYFCNLF